MDTKEYIENQELQKQKELKEYLQSVENKKKDIKNFVKRTIATGLVFGSILTGTACGIKNPNNQTTTNPNQATTLDTTTSTIGTDTTGTTTDSGKIDEPILTEKERYQKALNNFEKAIMVVKNNHNDIPIHYLGLYKHEFEDKESEYGFYLESFIEDYIYRIADYSLSEEEYNYAIKLYENKQFARNELLTNKYLETTLSDNLENVKTASDYTVLDIYSNIILEKENIKQSEASEEFEKYYELLNEKRGEVSNSFKVAVRNIGETKEYYINFNNENGQSGVGMYSTIFIDESFAKQIADVYGWDLNKLVNCWSLNKNEFLIKADDETLRGFTQLIKAKIDFVNQYVNPEKNM